MKENKPLIFINSAQTNNFKDQSQYVYDSRYDKKDKINVSKEVEKKDNENITINKNEGKESNNDLNQAEEDNNEFERREMDQNTKRLLNKIDLLNKRAKLGRYVLVSIETNDYKVEGLFINKLENEIVLEFDNKEENIPIEDILEINILKV